MIGDIMTISRLRMGTDGQGVSTLVSFFGCPLHCRYCINNFCHEDAKDFCGIPRGAYTPEELVLVLEKDDIYYQMSGGGIVFGGGEPLLQSEFIQEVCKLANPSWKKRIETSLNVPWEMIEPLISLIDEWIIDIKDMNNQIYIEYTGIDNENVVNNLCRLEEKVDNENLRIRIPHIPGFNTEDDIRESVRWVKCCLDVEPDVFEYYKTPEINEDSGY